MKEGTQLKGTRCVLTNAFISLFLSLSTACHTGTCLRLTLDSRGAIVELQWFKHHRKQTNKHSRDYSYIVLALVAQISDSTMHQINHYSVGIFRENTYILRFTCRFIQWIALPTLWATGTWFVTKKLVSFCVIVFSFASGEEQSCELSLLCRTLQWPHK